MSIYREALQASPERISALDEPTLNGLMRDLLIAHAYVASANVAEVEVNTSTKAPDGGADAVTPAPAKPDPWFGDTKTCWQFKAGREGEPAKLKGEIVKPIPKQVLQSGGRVGFVCNGSVSGEKGEKARLKVVVEEAAAAGLPTDRIEVIGSERLTTWCNLHPAIASSQAGRPAGLWRLSEWRNSDEHDVEWQPIKRLQDAVDALESDLAFDAGDLLHLHVCGHPGVGKTRFALELCKAAPWANSVIYIRQAADLRLSELLGSAVADKGVRLVIVADEAQLSHLEAWRETLSLGDGRVRLITVGTSASPDPARIRPLVVEPLSIPETDKVVRAWFPSMPLERAQFVAEFSDGFIRLARLAASTIDANPSMDVRTLLEERHIQMFLDKMLGTEDRAALYVVAVLKSVGWTDDSEVEAITIAEHLGLSWAKVRADVERFDRQYRVAPRGGRLRYISPEPLGTYLALEAWRIYGKELRTLPDKLTESGKDAYYNRLQALASTPQAGPFAREQLDLFFPVADLNDARAMRRWSALASANPASAARRMREELGRRSPEERRSIVRRARGALISGLVGLAWSSDSFEDATFGLALLAESENETYTNNSTGEFLHRFTLWLSGTSVPYLNRLRVLDELLASDSSELRRLALLSLAQVGNRSAFLVHRTPITRGLPPAQWEPSSKDEHVGAVKAAITRVQAAVETRDTELGPTAGKVVADLSKLLRQEPVRDAMVRLVTATAQAFPEQREKLRRAVADILEHERKHWKELGPEALQAIEAVRDTLADRSPSGQLRELTGPWPRRDDPDALRAVAHEFAANPALLEAEWAWLTSSETFGLGVFGRELGTANLDELVVQLLRSPKTGRDGSLLAGYASRRAEDESTGWLDAFLDGLLASVPARADIVFEVTWRLTASEEGAQRVARIVREDMASSETIGQLAYSAWGERLDARSLRVVLDALMYGDRHAGVALALVQARVKKAPDEFPEWADVGLRLATNETLIRTNRHEGYEWAQWAKRFVDTSPTAIYAAAIKAQAKGDEQHSWFLEHTFGVEVVADCVVRDPVGTWEAMRPYLEAEYSTAYRFTIGFPEGFVDRMERGRILEWAATDPSNRVSLLAQLVAWDLSDDSLAATLIDRYASDPDVASAFHSRVWTGSWSGSASEHWATLARSLREAADRTSRPGLRRWASEVALALDESADRDRIREEEEDLRGR